MITVLVFVAAAPADDLPPGGTFIDDDGSIFEGSIEAIAAAGITLGCNPPTNNKFCPDQNVNRGEMAAFLVRALELTDPGPGNFFTDDDGSVFEADIDILAYAGITKGCNPPDNDQFCPGVSVTRGAMAAFLVRGYGYTDPGVGDLFTDDDGIVFEDDIDKLGTAGITKGCNPPDNDQFCPFQTVTRAEMAAFLQRAEGLDPIVPPPASTPELNVFLGGLSSPVQVTAPDGDDRVFIVEKRGTIRIAKGGVLSATPFLDVQDIVWDSGERGLLSMAFHPNYAVNGRFFVFYSSFDTPAFCPGDCHTSKIVEYTVSADPDIADTTAKLIIEVDQPYSNHNGGQLAFGPDGYLYIGTGDGGSGNDPHKYGQDKNNLNGSILRLDVDGASPYAIPADNPFVNAAGLDEIWAIGLRNPWRFSFDGEYLYIGDVGQNAREEIDAVHAPTSAGVNFGWCTYEGTVATGNGCGGSGFTFPVLEYAHGTGCDSVSGGHVYRGDDLPQLDGVYFYADYCKSWIKSFRLVNGVATELTDWTATLGAVPSIVAFGTDGVGGFYVVSVGGTVYRLEAA